MQTFGKGCMAVLASKGMERQAAQPHSSTLLQQLLQQLAEHECSCRELLLQYLMLGDLRGKCSQCSHIIRWLGYGTADMRMVRGLRTRCSTVPDP